MTSPRRINAETINSTDPPELGNAGHASEQPATHADNSVPSIPDFGWGRLRTFTLCPVRAVMLHSRKLRPLTDWVNDVHERERRFRRRRTGYRLYAALTGLSLVSVIAGFPLRAVNDHLGAGLIVYGLLGFLLFLSLLFIQRSRYTRAKVAHEAHRRAQERTTER